MMRAILFDLDGTLVHTNEGHVATWLEAFSAFGYRVGKQRIEREIGRAGDMLVPEVLGRDADEEHGEGLRAHKAKAFAEWLKEKRPHFEDGALEALRAVTGAGYRTALATSSSKEDLEALESALDMRFRDLVEVVVTATKGERGKPAPDVVLSACEALKLDPLQCALVGDSLFDAAAARRAGVAFIGVATGFASADSLAKAGARHVSPNMTELERALSRAVSACERTVLELDAATLRSLMQPALDAALSALLAFEAPIGAALYTADGQLLAAGHNEAIATGDVTMHAELSAFRRASEKGMKAGQPAILVSTLEPCVMCLGAAMEAGVDVVVFGLPAPADGGVVRVAPPTSPENIACRVRGGVEARSARHLFLRWRNEVATASQLPYVEQLLRRTDSDGRPLA